jgi:hypothetical protein
MKGKKNNAISPELAAAMSLFCRLSLCNELSVSELDCCLETGAFNQAQFWADACILALYTPPLRNLSRRVTMWQ